jgi:predicted nucleic acid-binding protein
MTSPVRIATTLVIDTSVLVNFLAIDRFDLVRGLADQAMATDHVAGEITDDYPEQKARYERAVLCGDLTVATVNQPDAIAAFGRLVQERVLGAGECSAIALAGTMGHALAIDDKRAKASAARAFPKMHVLGTKDIMVAAIKAGHLAVSDADAIKAEWESRYRFKFRFQSFADIL